MANRLVNQPGEHGLLDFVQRYPGLRRITSWRTFIRYADVEYQRLRQIEDRLGERGHQFSDKIMLKQFLADNATIITYPDKPNYREMYLFAGTDKQEALASWWETYEFTPNYDGPESGYKITVVA